MVYEVTGGALDSIAQVAQSEWEIPGRVDSERNQAELHSSEIKLYESLVRGMFKQTKQRHGCEVQEIRAFKGKRPAEYHFVQA
eukprot:COSAG06_NODE_2106_length_7572_cov_7.446675_2_plen_83_part_00